MKRFALVVYVLVLFAAEGHAQKTFTVDQVTSAPFPTELTAAPAKGRVAWVFNQRGRRNLWVAEAAADGSYKAKQLTHYNDDDGQDVGQLSWSADAETIAFTRGGDLEFANAANPNPANEAGAVEQDVWVIATQGGEPKSLGEGHSPAVSPKGDVVAFLNKGQIWSARLDGSGKAEQLIHANGNAGSLRWAPDGSKLVFVSGRGDHAFIGLYDVPSKSVLYLDPSVDRDLEPVWSPDSRQIAFVRSPGNRSALPFSPRREGEPWSIMVAGAATGKARVLWRAEAGRGSVFHEIVAENQLLWSGDGHIIFPWERDGWIHLYSIPVTGGAPKLLTPGNFEVEYVALSENREVLTFSSNQDDIDRRHVWKTSATADRPTAVTSGGGIETAPVVASDNRTILVLRSDARAPMRPALVSAKGDLHDLAPEAQPSDFPASALVTPQQVILSAADGMQIHAQLFLPANANDGSRHPAVIFFHGGSRRQMLLGWHYMYYYSNAYAMNQFLASRGYVVLSVNYRSGIGYGLDFREALNYGAAGASEFNDVQGAGVYLRGRSDVDPRRIGVWGGSYGGYLTALALARASDLFAAGVDFHGVHDWNTEIPTFAAGYQPEQRQEFARKAWESSPLSSISTWHSPVLLIHGDDDRNVPFSETVELVEGLRKQHVEFEQLIFPGEIHDFLMWRSWVSAYRAASDFFDRHFAAKQAGTAANN
jgi:dipeptidyl aminopeptidase/acylaminoacyl peptidase